MKPYITLAISFTCLAFSSCFLRSDQASPVLQETTISSHAAVRNFSVHPNGDRLYIIYPSIDALSLNLITADVSAQPLRPSTSDTTYLDRISYTPDIDSSFGRHAFLSQGSFHHILYLDRENEDDAVLKWLSKTEQEQTWWIDAFPGLSVPLLALSEGPQAIQALVMDDGAFLLYRLSRDEQPERLAASPAGAFRSQGDISVLKDAEQWAITAYDGSRLYYLQRLEDTIRAEAIYTSGEVHFSTWSNDRLTILVYEPDQSTLTLLERERHAPESQPFQVVPVTLCSGATSVYLAACNDKRLFIFNERVIDQQDRTGYQVSLLYPGAADPEYEKLILIESDKQIEDFEALEVGGILYVLYVKEDALTLLSLRLSDLLSSDSD